MASVATYLHHVRPTVVGYVVALVALAMTPHERVVPTAVRAVELERQTSPIIIDLPALSEMPVIRPAPHPDAREWPLGMVITPPPIHDPIVLWDGSPLDDLLSALIIPFRIFDT